MRFTPTAKYLSYANAAARNYTWQIYIKKTTAINEALSTGTWVEVTDKVDLESLADQITRIEYEVGQYVRDSITLIGRDIAWWDANIFNASASQYLEVKIQFKLGQGTDICSDTIYTFSGFAEKQHTRQEIGDSVQLTIFTAEDQGDRTAAEVLTTQYLDTDIDGGGTDGLALPKLPRLFVKSANVTDFPLKVGTHELNYGYNAGTERMNLDGGDWVTLANGTNTLINPDGDQKIEIHCQDATQLSRETAITEKIVVVTQGTTLPKNWYTGISLKRLLGVIYTQLGISTITYDTLEYDAALGSAKVSFIDIPPQEGNMNRYKWAMVADSNGDLWMGVGNKLYKRTMSTDTYSLQATLTNETDRISRLFYNQRNGHIWLYYGNNSSGEGKVRRFVISGATLSSEISVTNSSRNNCALMDVNYTGSSYLYKFVFANSSSREVREVDGSSPGASTLIFDQATLGYTGAEGPNLNFSFVDNNQRFNFQVDSATGIRIHRISVDVLGAWTDDGQLTGSDIAVAYELGAFDPDEDKIYFWDPVNRFVKNHARNGTSTTNVLTLSASTGDEIEEMKFANSKTYFTLANGRLYSAESDTATYLNTDAIQGTPTGVPTQFFVLTFANSRLYGIDVSGRLFQYHTTVALYIPIADFSGQTVTGALNEVLGTFLMIGKISSIKAAAVYRRGNSSGTPQTTGNTFSITISDPSDIVMVEKHILAVAFARVSNGTVEWAFNGTTYQTSVLSDVRKIEIDSPLISGEVVQDLCKQAYVFFSIDRDLYTFKCGVLPLFQFEPFDNCNVTLTTTKIALTATSGTSRPIYGVKISRNCSMEVEVLI